jgi:hypothetical protein
MYTILASFREITWNDFVLNVNAFGAPLLALMTYRLNKRQDERDRTREARELKQDKLLRIKNRLREEALRGNPLTFLPPELVWDKDYDGGLMRQAFEELTQELNEKVAFQRIPFFQRLEALEKDNSWKKQEPQKIKI